MPYWGHGNLYAIVPRGGALQRCSDHGGRASERSGGNLPHRGRRNNASQEAPGEGRSSRLFEASPEELALLMAVKHPKRPRDPNQLAKLIVELASGGAD